MAIYRNQAGEIAIDRQQNTFYNDVIRGLTSTPKRLQSKYFYDETGDALFQQIMNSEEYYLTNCELEIFSQQTPVLAQTLLEKYKDFDVVELGAGDATKTVHLLQYLVETGARFTYYPVDISGNVIRYLEKELPEKIEGISVTGLQGEYFDMIKQANQLSDKRKLVLFLGSNIGNFSKQEAIEFLTSLGQCLLPGDVMLIGFDLKKNPAQILAAYNDAAGITRAFNLNLLHRINRELGGNFNVSQFSHYPTYDPMTGACRSYLISLCDQEVTIADTETIYFQKNEPVYMELSQKYSVSETDSLASKTGFTPVHHFFDSERWFTDAVWQKV